jgi:hypothetical protein
MEPTGPYSGPRWFSSPYSGYTTAFPFIASVNNDPGPQTNRESIFSSGAECKTFLSLQMSSAPNGVGLHAERDRRWPGEFDSDIPDIQ